MKIRLMLTVVLSLALLLPDLAAAGWAGRGRGRDNDRRGEHNSYREREQAHIHDRGWALDRRYNHDHYYPRPGYVARDLSRHHRIIRYRSERFYYDGGIWYRPGPGGYVVVTPPFGVVVPLLPPFYTTIWVGNVPYYYADGVYYRWLAGEQAYVVSEPPPEKQVVPESAIPKELYIYPKQGQSQQQQDNDRYECHRWSTKQTGFDPTQPGGNVTPEQNAGKHVDYQRAMKACLEARGYSVQ